MAGAGLGGQSAAQAQVLVGGGWEVFPQIAHFSLSENNLNIYRKGGLARVRHAVDIARMAGGGQEAFLHVGDFVRSV